MSFFTKLKERLTRSSSRIEQGIDALVEEAPATEAEHQPAAQTSPPPPPALPLAATPVLPVDVPPEPPASIPPERPGLVGRLFGREARVEEPRRVVDDAMLESLEELLIQADMGVETALRVTASRHGQYRRRTYGPPHVGQRDPHGTGR